MPLSQPLVRGAVVLLLGVPPLFSSCVSKPTATVEPKTVEGEQIVLRAGEYESVSVTGSNIPVLVSKSASARRLPTAPAVTTMTPEEFERLVRNGDVLSRR